MRIDSLTFTGAGGATARVSFGSEADGRPVATVTTTDGKGRQRARKVKHAGRFDAAYRELAADALARKVLADVLGRGFVLRPPQNGDVDLAVATEVGPPLGYAFGVDEARGVAWVADWGALRRVDLASAEVHATSLGDWRGAREVTLSPDGTPLVLAEFFPAPVKGAWLPPALGKAKFAVLRVAGDDVTPLVTAAGNPVGAVDPPACALGCATDGTFVGPHDEGLGIYRGDGELERVVAVRAGQHHLATGAIDPSGRWVAASRGEGLVARYDRQTGAEVPLAGPFEAIAQLAVRADGRVYARVYALTGGHDVVSLEPGRPPRPFGLRTGTFSLSADGCLVFAITGRDAVAVVDADTGREVATVVPLGGDLKRVASGSSRLYTRGAGGLFQRVAVRW